MNIQIVEPENYSSGALVIYGSLGRVIEGEVSSAEKSEIHVLVVRLKFKLSAEYLSGYTNLRYIVTPTTGLTHIDEVVCGARGIEIVSLRNCQDKIDRIRSTSELTVGLILSIIRFIPAAHSSVVQDRCWDRNKFVSRELSELTIGLIGVGRVGGHVAEVAQTFGMRVKAYDPGKDNKHFKKLHIASSAIEEVLSDAHIVSIHASFDDSNYHLIGRKEIAIMKAGSFIVNTARGELLDEEAVYEALKSGHLSGVAVDVLEDENSKRMLQESLLVKAAQEGMNVLITPHIGGCTTDAMRNTEQIMAEYFVARVLGN